jgi:hypothetical protein
MSSSTVTNHQNPNAMANKIPPSTKKPKEKLILGKNVSIAQRIRWIKLPPHSVPNLKITHWPGIIYKSYNELYADFKSNNRLSSEIKAKIFIDHRKLLQQKNGRKSETSNDYIIAIVCLGNTYSFLRFVDRDLVSNVKQQMEAYEDCIMDEGNDCSSDEDSTILPFYPYFEKFENHGIDQMGSDFDFQNALEQVQQFLEEDVKELNDIDFIVHEPCYNKEVPEENCQNSSAVESNKIISPEGNDEICEASDLRVKKNANSKKSSKGKDKNSKNVIARSIEFEFQGENVKTGRVAIPTKTHNVKEKVAKKNNQNSTESLDADVAPMQQSNEGADPVEEDASTVESQFGDDEEDEELVFDDGLKNETKSVRPKSNKSTDSKTKRERDNYKSGKDSKSVSTKRYKRRRIWGKAPQSALRNKERSPMVKLTFKGVWEELKTKGWTHIKARNKLHNWYYLKPHVQYDKTKNINGEIGVDYFLSEEQLLKYLEENREILSPANSTSSSMSVESSLREDASPANSTSSSMSVESSLREDASPANSPLSEQSSEQEAESEDDMDFTPEKQEKEYNFKYVWGYLKAKGWKHINATNPLHNWYYLKPNVDHSKSEISGEEGVDYFITESDLLQYIKENDHILSPSSEASVERNSSEHQNRQSLIKDDATVPETPDDSTYASDEGVWWKSSPIPDFTKEVWPVLKKIVRYKSSHYCVKMFDKEFKFEKVESAQQFIALHGLEIRPEHQHDLDADKLEILSRWISLAHLPTRVDKEYIRPHNSLDILCSIEVLDSNTAWNTLCYHYDFQCSSTKDGRLYAPNVGFSWDRLSCQEIKQQYFDSIEELRQYIRAHGMKGGIKESKELVSIMLWASGADVDPFITIQEEREVDGNVSNVEEKLNNKEVDGNVSNVEEKLNNNEVDVNISNLEEKLNNNEVDVNISNVEEKLNNNEVDGNVSNVEEKLKSNEVDALICNDGPSVDVEMCNNETSMEVDNDTITKTGPNECNDPHNNRSLDDSIEVGMDVEANSVEVSKNNDESNNHKVDTMEVDEDINDEAKSTVYGYDRVANAEARNQNEAIGTKTGSPNSTSTSSRSPNSRFIDTRSVLEQCTDNEVSDSKNEEIYEDCIDYDENEEHSYNQSSHISPLPNRTIVYGNTFMTQAEESEEDITREDYYHLSEMFS